MVRAFVFLLAVLASGCASIHQEISRGVDEVVSAVGGVFGQSVTVSHEIVVFKAPEEEKPIPAVPYPETKHDTIWLPWNGQGYNNRAFPRMRTDSKALDAYEAAKVELKRRAIRCDRIGKAYDGESGECVNR